MKFYTLFCMQIISYIYFQFYLKTRFIELLLKKKGQLLYIGTKLPFVRLTNCCSGKKTTDIALKGVNLNGNTSITAWPLDLNRASARTVLGRFHKSCTIPLSVMHWYRLMINIAFNDRIDISNFNKSVAFWCDANI